MRVYVPYVGQMLKVCLYLPICMDALSQSRIVLLIPTSSCFSIRDLPQNKLVKKRPHPGECRLLSVSRVQVIGTFQSSRPQASFFTEGKRQVLNQ